MLAEGEDAHGVIIAPLVTDAVALVFSRLPVDTLAQSRCVSKSWCQFIDTRQSLYHSVSVKGVRGERAAQMLQFASERAGGGMRVLDVSGIKEMDIELLADTVQSNGGASLVSEQRK